MLKTHHVYASLEGKESAVSLGYGSLVQDDPYVSSQCPLLDSGRSDGALGVAPYYTALYHSPTTRITGYYVQTIHSLPTHLYIMLHINKHHLNVEYN